MILNILVALAGFGEFGTNERRFRYSRITGIVAENSQGRDGSRRSVLVVPTKTFSSFREHCGSVAWGRWGNASLIGQTLEAGLCSRARRREIGYGILPTTLLPLRP